MIRVIKRSPQSAAPDDERQAGAGRVKSVKSAATAPASRLHSEIVNDQGSSRSKMLQALKDLPDKCWTEEPHDQSGIQFFTRVKIGLSTHDLMLDGGSGVNSTTEELVLKLINENEAQGISMSDKRHPIKRLGKWKHEEALCGVAGSARVPLIGSVVVNIQMTEMGKNTGPEILVRFKVCKAGCTDWVGWILGARALDCQARGGLGFLPLEHGHSFSALGIITERSERPAKPRLDECYPVRLVSSVDDDAQAWESSVEARLGSLSGMPAPSAFASSAGAPPRRDRNSVII